MGLGPREIDLTPLQGFNDPAETPEITREREACFAGLWAPWWPNARLPRLAPLHRREKERGELRGYEVLGGLRDGFVPWLERSMGGFGEWGPGSPSRRIFSSSYTLFLVAALPYIVSGRRIWCSASVWNPTDDGLSVASYSFCFATGRLPDTRSNSAPLAIGARWPVERA